MQTLHELQRELKICNEELHAEKENVKKFLNEKVLLEQKISKLEKKTEEVILLMLKFGSENAYVMPQNDIGWMAMVCIQMEILEKSFEQERKALKLQVSELERKLGEATLDLATLKSTLASRNMDLAGLESHLKELEELREMKEVIIFQCLLLP